jgi:hypothetical protein
MFELNKRLINFKKYFLFKALFLRQNILTLLPQQADLFIVQPVQNKN